MTADQNLTVGLVCVRNAGRSQMAAAFAEQERQDRGLAESVDVRTGGTRPADRVHEVVLEAMNEVGIDLADRTPRQISTAELQACDYVVSMGCSTLDLGETATDVDVRDWELNDPHGEDLARVREIRDEVRDRVSALFDEIERRQRNRVTECE